VPSPAVKRIDQEKTAVRDRGTLGGKRMTKEDSGEAQRHFGSIEGPNTALCPSHRLDNAVDVHVVEEQVPARRGAS